MAEFWGVEVKSGEPLVIECGDGFGLHLSQACLGEVKKNKGNEHVTLTVKINDKKIVLGTLSSEKFPQLSFDLHFNNDFELSHNWKHGSVYFSGNKVLLNAYSSDDESESEPEIREEDLVVAANNGKPGSDTKKPQPVTEKAKPDTSGPKQTVKIVEPNKDDKPDEETDDSSGYEDESSDEGDFSDDKDTTTNGEDDESDEEDDESDDDSDESDDSDDEDEKTPAVRGHTLNTERGKKRSAESSGLKKTPLPEKKVKMVTPQKTDGKKGSGHVATPHPSKKIVKTPASSDQKKEQTHKSFSCASCNRSFGSEGALQSHSKAKHSAA